MGRSRAKRKSGADQRSLQRALAADADLLAFQLRAVTARGGEEFLTHGIVNDRMLQPALLLHRDRDGESREAMQEIGGAIERIDDPRELIFAAAARFLGVDCVLRVAAPDGRDDVRLGLAVDVGDEIIAAFAVDFQGIESRQAFDD